MSDFYAVKAGVKPGIYLTWKECENNTKGFPNARYKKFSSKDLALQFINESNCYRPQLCSTRERTEQPSALPPKPYF